MYVEKPEMSVLSRVCKFDWKEGHSHANAVCFYGASGKETGTTRRTQNPMADLIAPAGQIPFQHKHNISDSTHIIYHLLFIYHNIIRHYPLARKK